MKPRDSDEEKQELVDKLHAYDLEIEVMTPIEARDVVQRSGMLLVPIWDLEKAFMLDQIRRKENTISYEAFEANRLPRGSRFNIDSRSLEVWSISPTKTKPKLMNMQSTGQ